MPSLIAATPRVIFRQHRVDVERSEVIELKELTFFVRFIVPDRPATAQPLRVHNDLRAFFIARYHIIRVVDELEEPLQARAVLAREARLPVNGDVRVGRVGACEVLRRPI